MTDNESEYNDIRIWMSFHKNTIGDLSRMIDIIVEDTPMEYGDVYWHVENTASEKIVVLYIDDVIASQLRLIEDDISEHQWDGPRPVLDWEE